MANYAEEPLTRVTLNLFKRDVLWFQEKYPRGWSRKLRQAVRDHVFQTELMQIKDPDDAE